MSSLNLAIGRNCKLSTLDRSRLLLIYPKATGALLGDPPKHGYSSSAPYDQITAEMNDIGSVTKAGNYLQH